MSKEQQQYQKLVMTPVEQLIPRLAIPTILSMMITMIYNLVDAYFVGKLGTSASAAIGVVLGVQSIFQAFGFMMGHGAGSQISLKLGEGDRDAADRLFSTAFFHALVISVIVGIICLFGLEPLMRLMGSTDTILPFSKNYGFYILISGPALVGSCVLNNVMRYEGRAVLAMVGLVTGGVLNMIGDPILMFGLGLGIDGAGLSTAISQYISFGILLYMVFSKRTDHARGLPEPDPADAQQHCDNHAQSRCDALRRRGDRCDGHCGKDRDVHRLGYDRSGSGLPAGVRL